uniref:Uncharacterized protein n=1 Tax=Arundo donax TaxID=35708 RepID=A0A0A9FMV5_ARUDO
MKCSDDQIKKVIGAISSRMYYWLFQHCLINIINLY